MASTEDETPGERLAKAIKEGRQRLGWTQDDLVAESGVSRPTILRFESGRTTNPAPETVRAVFTALGIDPREAPVILGYVTRDEMGLPPQPPREFSGDIEEVIAILEDPNVPNAQKQEWVAYLRYRTQRSAPAEQERPRPVRRRAAG